MVPGVADLGAQRVVDIYTDGACRGNPGPGGWGVVLRCGEYEKEIYGGEATATTNNRMELTAPIRALESLTRPSAVQLHTDSTYVRDGITKWVPRWRRNGWQTVSKQPVKGHAGHPENERADRLAATGLREAVSSAGRAGSQRPSGPARW